MKDYINEIAYMIAEASEEISFNDINVILKKLGKERNEFTLDRDAYEKLPDDMKEEIHMYAQKDTLNKDEIDTAQAYTIDTDKIINWINDKNRRMHHIDSDGFYRDNEGR